MLHSSHRISLRCSPLVMALIVWSAAFSLPTLTAQANEPTTLTDAERLALVYGRQARIYVQFSGLTPTILETSKILLDEAVDLAPEDEHLWRMQLEMAMLSEDEPRKRLALERLRDLAPNDDVVELRQLQYEVERHQTASARIQAYERLLRGNGDERPSAPIASRLAYDLALLHQRTGNTDAFADWLGQAVALDQSNYSAAALAAGFFRDHVDDPFAEAELLVNLLLSNPIDETAQLMLGAHVLNHGAYAGADRLLTMALRTREAMRYLPRQELIADIAIARWGTGSGESALRAIRSQQHKLNQIYRASIRRDQPEIDPVELARHHAPLSPELATTFAVISRAIESDHAEDSIDALRRAYEHEINLYEADEAESETDHTVHIAMLHLEYAWVLFWLNGDLDQAQSHRDQARALRELSDRAESRFDGWLALREGSTGRAIELLRPLAEEDHAARVGLAIALQTTGARREAAHELLALAREQQGTLIGVWAADRLYQLLGQRAPVTDIARRLDRLIDRLPNGIDRLADQPTTGVSIRVRSTQTTYEPYEPIVVHVEMTNHLPIPLAIGEDGPIQPRIVLIPSMQIANIRSPRRMESIVVSLDQRLRLEPRERLVIPVDLRRKSIGAQQEIVPVYGALMRVRGVLNFFVNEYNAIRPGLLGSEHETPPIRVDGIRADRAWMQNMHEELTERGNRIDVADLAILSHMIGTDPDEAWLDIDRQLITNLRLAYAERWSELSPAARSWLLAMMPRRPAFDPIYNMVRERHERLEQLTYLVFVVGSDDDPMIAVAKRSDDAHVRRLGEVIDRIADQRRRLEEEQLMPGGSAGDTPGLPLRER